MLSITGEEFFHKMKDDSQTQNGGKNDDTFFCVQKSYLPKIAAEKNQLDEF